MNRKLKLIEKQKLQQDKYKKIYLMQSVALTNYAKLCNKINEVPRLDIIDMLANCEDVKKLLESNKMFLSELNKTTN